jgi:hypothetical protein
MVQLSSFLVSLLLLAASVANPLKRTVAQIEADIATITTQVTTLHSAVQAFPASGSTGALVFVVNQLHHIGLISPAVLQGIHSDATALETTVNQAAVDLKVVLFALLCDRQLIFSRRLDLLARRMLQLLLTRSWLLNLPCWMHCNNSLQKNPIL